MTESDDKNRSVSASKQEHIETKEERARRRKLEKRKPLGAEISKIEQAGSISDDVKGIPSATMYCCPSSTMSSSLEIHLEQLYKSILLSGADI